MIYLFIFMILEWRGVGVTTLVKQKKVLDG